MFEERRGERKVGKSERKKAERKKEGVDKLHLLFALAASEQRMHIKTREMLERLFSFSQMQFVLA